MASNNNFSQFFSQDNFPSMQGAGWGIYDMLDCARKNVEALTQAQQVAFEGLQAAAQHHAEFLTRILKDNSSLAHEIMNENTPEQKIARLADLMKKNYEFSVAEMRELMDMVNQSNLQTSDVLHRRVSASFTEMKSNLEKTGKAAAAARQKAAA